MNNAISVHSMEEEHLPSWDKVEVLEWEQNLLKRKVLESNNIKKKKTQYSKLVQFGATSMD